MTYDAPYETLSRTIILMTEPLQPTIWSSRSWHWGRQRPEAGRNSGIQPDHVVLRSLWSSSWRRPWRPAWAWRVAGAPGRGRARSSCAFVPRTAAAISSPQVSDSYALRGDWEFLTLRAEPEMDEVSQLPSSGQWLSRARLWCTGITPRVAAHFVPNTTWVAALCDIFNHGVAVHGSARWWAGAIVIEPLLSPDGRRL